MSRLLGNKSMKRETALLLLVIWLALTVRMFFFAPVDNINALNAAYAMVTTSILMYIAAVQGLHSVLNRMYPYQAPGPNTGQQYRPPQSNDDVADPGVLHRSLPLADEPAPKKAPAKKRKS